MMRVIVIYSISTSLLIVAISGCTTQEPYYVDSNDLLIQQNRLLAEADTQIRSGLIELSNQFPYMRRAEGWERITFNKSKTGTIYINVTHTNTRKGGGTIPIPEMYGVLVVVIPHTSEPTKYGMSPLYRNLGLVGWVGASAQNIELRVALEKLVEDALAPLELLNGIDGRRLLEQHQK